MNGADRLGNLDWLPGYFKDQEVFIVGSGPSLRFFDYERLRGKNVISLNHASRFCPHSIALFIDAAFRREYQYDWYTHPQKVLCSMDAGLYAGGNVGVFRLINDLQLNPNVGLIQRIDKWSGTTAINAAMISGASKIYLMGIDCKFFDLQEMLDVCGDNGASEEDIRKTVSDYANRKKIGHSTSGMVDHFSDREEDEYKFQRAIKSFDKFKGKAEIINLSRHSALTVFPKQNINEIIKQELFTS
jgi:hypothetical protein